MSVSVAILMQTHVRIIYQGKVAIMFTRVVFLYKIDNGESQFYYTNANRNIQFNTILYEAVPISHDGIENDSNEVTKGKCVIHISNQTDYIQQVLQQYDAYLTKIAVLRYYLATGDVETEFVGTLSTLEFSVKEATLSFTNVIYDTQRGAMRLVYQRQCPFALYGKQCKANKEDHAHYSTLSQWTRIDDYNLQFSDTLPEYIEGGIMQLPNKAWFFIRLVDYTENTITVSRPVYQSYLETDETTVVIYEGCDRTIQTCRNRFYNDDNYGGFTLLPLENPTERNHLANNDLEDNTQVMKSYINNQKS